MQLMSLVGGATRLQHSSQQTTVCLSVNQQHYQSFLSLIQLYYPSLSIFFFLILLSCFIYYFFFQKPEYLFYFIFLFVVLFLFLFVCFFVKG